MIRREICILAVSFLLLFAGCATSIDPGQHEAVRIIAHRGFADIYVENTLEAVTSSLEAGADAVEFDISVSADGIPYLFHDEEVDSLTDGTGTFTELESSYIESLRYIQADGTSREGIGIPRLSEALKALRELDGYIYAEIKRIRDDSDVAMIAEKIRSYGFEDSSRILSFRSSDFAVVNEVMPDASLGYLVRFRGLPNFLHMQEHADRMREYDNVTMLYHYLNILHAPRIVDYCRDLGMEVGAWAVNRRTTFYRLVHFGVHQIITDHPGFMHQ